MNGRQLGPFVFLAALGFAAQLLPAARAQNVERAVTTTGPRNPPLYEGALAFQTGQDEEGVRLTLEGLSLAQGKREQETALSNLCTGYLRLRQFESALRYCNMLLGQNENAWRAYNSRAMVYLELKEYEKADQDLTRAEAINPSARTLAVARAMWRDAVYPVAPVLEIDDRKNPGDSHGAE
jgi:tetratricopeptide (TPR) repeat protein